LILRGVTTLTNDDASSRTEKTSMSVLVISRESNGTTTSRNIDEYVGKLIQRTSGV